MRKYVDISEHARIKFQKDTKKGYKCSVELAEAKLKRDWELGKTTSRGAKIEYREYGCLEMKVDLITNTMISVKNFKTRSPKEVDKDLKYEIETELGIKDMEIRDGVKGNWRHLIDINSKAMESFVCVLREYDLTYIQVREIITRMVNEGIEMGIINDVRYVHCDKFVASIKLDGNVVTFLTWTEEAKEGAA